MLSSIAADAGYLVLIPLGAAAFLTVGRHPIAGIAAAFAGVAAVFLVNVIIVPVDGILTEITNDAIHLLDPNVSIDLAANLYFSIVVQRDPHDRLRAGHRARGRAAARPLPRRAAGPGAKAASRTPRPRACAGRSGASSRSSPSIALLTVPEGAPLRDPVTGAIGGNSPFMSSLIVIIMLIFLVIGLAYGIAAGTIRNATDAIDAIVKTFAGLSGMIFLLLIISQFIAYFNYSNLATIAAVNLANLLQDANLDTLVLLVGFVVVVGILDLIITGAVPEMGDLRADLRALDDEAGRRARGGARGLPDRQFADERDHAAQRLFRHGGRLLPEVRQGRRRRHRGGDDAALCRRPVRGLARCSWSPGTCWRCRSGRDRPWGHADLVRLDEEGQRQDHRRNGEAHLQQIAGSTGGDHLLQEQHAQHHRDDAGELAFEQVDIVRA